MLTSQNIDLRWILLATIVESGICRFWGWHDCVTFFWLLFFLRAWNQNFFPHARENSPVQPLLRKNLGWLLCPPIHWKPSKLKTPALSIFIFSLPHTFRPVTSPLQLPPHRRHSFFVLTLLTNYFVGVIVYVDKRTGWIRYDLLD